MVGLARQLEEALLDESFVINGAPGGPYFLQQTVLGDVSLTRDANDTWRVVQSGKELASGLRFKERTFWKDVQKALQNVATSAPPPAEFDFKSSADVKTWMEKKIQQYGSKNALLASDEYRKAYPFIKKVNDAARTVSKAQGDAEAESVMTQAGLKYGDRVLLVHQHFLGATRAMGTLIRRGKTPTVEIDDADRVYFPKGQKTVAWDTRWKKAT